MGHQICGVSLRELFIRNLLVGLGLYYRCDLHRRTVLDTYHMEVKLVRIKPPPDVINLIFTIAGERDADIILYNLVGPIARTSLSFCIPFCTLPSRMNNTILESKGPCT